jgi:hypothetical protein
LSHLFFEKKVKKVLIHLSTNTKNYTPYKFRGDKMEEIIENQDREKVIELADYYLDKYLEAFEELA